MISTAKVAANRRNARKSTGPRTPEGKNIASMNAVKHGLSARMPVVPAEDRDEFHTYTERWIEELKPAGPLEEFLAERIIGIAWRLRRVGQIEAGLLPSSEDLATQQLSRLNRYETSLERSFYRNLQELRDLQAERAEAEPEAEETTDYTDSTDLQNEATEPQAPPNVLVNRPLEQPHATIEPPVAA